MTAEQHDYAKIFAFYFVMGDEVFAEAERSGADPYTLLVSKALRVVIKDVTAKQRAQAKIVTFGRGASLFVNRALN